MKEHGVGAKLIDYVSTGPKSYGLKVRRANGEIHTTVKSKGIQLNYTVGNVITFDTMCRLVDNFVVENEVEVVVVNNKQIRRDKDHVLITIDVPKSFRTTFTKRKLIDEYCSVPFGF